MARVSRHRRAPGSLEPGQLYHVTNRGVDRCPIFHSDLDRVVFLSYFAEACKVYGTICHAFCLMDTHFHLVVEDPRGVLSQMMHHLGFCYARYFNDSRCHQRSGPLFESRFRAELIDSQAYFQAAVSYVLLNPVRTKTHLTDAPDTYRWSSAALVCSEISAAAFCSALLAPIGGVAGVLAALRPSRFKVCRERRRIRLEALTSGAWLDRDRVLSDRPTEHYRQALLARATGEHAADEVRAAQSTPSATTATDDHLRFVTVACRPPYCGLDLDEIFSQIERTCSKLVPVAFLVSTRRSVDLFAYALWRFSSACADRIADVVGIARTGFDDVLREIRGTRLLDPGWQRLFGNLEWSLRWQLRAAPYRP